MCFSVRDDYNVQFLGTTTQREILGKTREHFHENDIEIKVQLPQWVNKGSPRPKKNSSVPIQRQGDGCCFCHFELLPRGRTVNREYYSYKRKKIARGDESCGKITHASFSVTML